MKYIITVVEEVVAWCSMVTYLKTLFEIALGTPISLDENTTLTTFGHFARVLIDIDRCEQLHESIMVERDCFAF